MRLLIALAAVAALSACAAKQEKAAVTPTGPDLTRNDCYTVVLFDKHPVKPAAEGVPAEHAAFLGEWTNGAWNGKWCHDILITEVEPGGRVSLVEMHAPYEPWNQPATAFKRTGRINDKGELRFAYGTEEVTYKVVNGRLMAKRSGILGNLEAQLKRPGDQPIPKPRPAQQVASAG